MDIPYYQGYEIPVPDHRRIRQPVNQSFRSEREAEKNHAHRKSEERRSASFHGEGKVRSHPDLAGRPNNEFNKMYTGRIPVFTPQVKTRDISFMLDQVKDEVRERETSHNTSAQSGTNCRILNAVGAAGVQFSAGFFLAATHITLISSLVAAPSLLTHNVNPNLHRIVFLVFSAVASAACAVLVPSARYRKLISSGAILLIFSCLSASLVTSGRFMFLPYGVVAGSAHGVLRTVSIVAANDIKSNYRVTSVSVAVIGQSLGGFMGTFVYYYFMTDYLTAATWTNNFRILELAAVLALLLGAVVRRPTVVMTPPSRHAGVVKDLGIHAVCFFYAIAFLAIGVVFFLMPVLPVARSFAFSKHETFFNPLLSLYCGQWLGATVLAVTGACCGKGAGRMSLFLGGVFVFLLGVAVMPHDPAYQTFWAFMGLSLGVGFVVAFAQIFVSVGVARRMGGAAVGVTVSLLMFWQDLGTMFGMVVVDQMTSDFGANEALYMSAGFLLFGGLGLIICYFTVRPLIRLKRGRKPFDADSDTSSSHEGREAGITNPGMGRWDGYEYDYRFMS